MTAVFWVRQVGTMTRDRIRVIPANSSAGYAQFMLDEGVEL